MLVLVFTRTNYTSRFLQVHLFKNRDLFTTVYISTKVNDIGSKFTLYKITHPRFFTRLANTKANKLI